jgi:hypothetical protein
MRPGTYKQRRHDWVRHDIAKQKTKKPHAVRRSWGYIQPSMRVRVIMKGIQGAYAKPVLLPVHNLLASFNRIVRALQLCEE